MSRSKIERFLKRVLHKALNGNADEAIWKIDLAIKSYAKYHKDDFYNEQKHINEFGYPLDAVIKDINNELRLVTKEGHRGDKTYMSFLNSLKEALIFEKDHYWEIEYKEIPLYHYFRFCLPSRWGFKGMYDPEYSPIRYNLEKIWELKHEKYGKNNRNKRRI